MAVNAENDLTLIITCIQQFWPDMPITEQLLDHPTSEFVIEFYQRFQETLNEMLSRIACTEIVSSNEPNASEDPIFPILCFVNKYLRLGLFNQADVDSMLTLSDLYEPSAKRTKVRFKVLINWLLFYEQKIDAVQSVITKRLEEAQACLNKKNEKNILQEKLANEAENFACTEDTFHKLQKEEEKANVRYKNIEKQKSEHDREHAAHQQELHELVNTYQNKVSLLTNVKTNIQSLNEQVVTEQSYNTLLDLKQSLVKKNSELKATIECLGKNLGNRQPEVERFDNINKELLLLNSACEELQVLQNCVSSTITQLQVSEENHNKKNGEIKTHNKNTLKYRESIKEVEEALRALTIKNNTVKEKMQQTLEQLKAELNKAQKCRSDIARNKDMLQEKIDELSNETEEIRSKIGEYNLFFANMYRNIINRNNASTSSFSTMLEKIREALSESEQDCEYPETEFEQQQ